MFLANLRILEAMIAYLKGILASKTPSSVIMDVNGVGYELNISLHTYSAIQDKEEALLYTHQIIREDAHLLYGFSELKEKEIFLGLVSVSGIGAGTARLILSYMKPDEVVAAITRGDSKALEQIKGIGKKTAERTVLELKDKVGKQLPDVPAIIGNNNPSIKQDALEALLALGIHRTQAEQALHRVLQAEPDLILEETIKKVLKAI